MLEMPVCAVAILCLFIYFQQVDVDDKTRQLTQQTKHCKRSHGVSFPSIIPIPRRQNQSKHILGSENCYEKCYKSTETFSHVSSREL